MTDDLLTPPQESILYEDDKLYICLAMYPITKGHTVVVWKERVTDLHSLDRDSYEYLMYMVDISRNMLMEEFGVEKVYLLYLDEVKHVHWHLVPRYDEAGFNVLTHTPEIKKDFKEVEKLKTIFSQKTKQF